MVIWCIGLSGSGKTTLGREIARQLRARQPNTVLLDGDELREVFAHGRGDEAYTVEGRRVNAERIVALCKLLDSQGINVICCILSIFAEMRDENRRRFGRYFEIFLDAPLHVLEGRDVKGLYKSARQGKTRNVVGIDIPFERPNRSDMVIDTSGDTVDVKKLAAEVLERVR